MNAILRYGVLLLLGLPLTATAGTTVAKGTDPTKQVLRGPIVTSDGSVLAGELVIEGDSITCVAADCPDPRGATVFTVSDAFIFPGFLDAHNLCGVHCLQGVQDTLRDIKMNAKPSVRRPPPVECSLSARCRRRDLSSRTTSSRRTSSRRNWYRRRTP
jgi:hypothetical protein